MNHNAGCDVEAMQECQIKEEMAQQLTSKEIMSHNTGYETTNDKNFLKQITSDSIIVPPVKRCIKCVGCKSCKKIHLPDQTRQLAHSTIVKESLTFDGTNYTASYAYNKYLTQL